MGNPAQNEREEKKTFAQHFLRKLEQEFEFAPRIAQAILDEAQSCLVEPLAELSHGQMWVLLAQRGAGGGQPLATTGTKLVRWTVDGGEEDRQVRQSQGAVALRQLRLQRLLDEALEQGAVASQEDLALVLNVDVRTIKRDFAALLTAGVSLPSRGYVQGSGRGQTHKAQIIRRWLRGESYDQLVISTRHHIRSIQRYIQTFVRIVALHQAGLGETQIAQLTQTGLGLVQEYLTVYQQISEPAWRQRLDDELERLQQRPRPRPAKKGGA